MKKRVVVLVPLVVFAASLLLNKTVQVVKAQQSAITGITVVQSGLLESWDVEHQPQTQPYVTHQVTQVEARSPKLGVSWGVSDFVFQNAGAPAYNGQVHRRTIHRLSDSSMLTVTDPLKAYVQDFPTNFAQIMGNKLQRQADQACAGLTVKGGKTTTENILSSQMISGVRAVEYQALGDTLDLTAWKAPDFGCITVQSVAVTHDTSGKMLQRATYKSSNIVVGEPDPSWWNIASDYTAHTPTEVMQLQYQFLQSAGVIKGQNLGNFQDFLNKYPKMQRSLQWADSNHQGFKDKPTKSLWAYCRSAVGL